MLAILLAQNILSNSAQGVISRQIRSFGRKLFGKHGVSGVTEKRFREAFSSSWNEYAPAQGQIFRKVMKALIENRLFVENTRGEVKKRAARLSSADVLLFPKPHPNIIVRKRLEMPT